MINKTAKKVLFITSSSLATNPRLVKNYISLASNGYTCKVIAFEYGDWSDSFSQLIIKEHGIDCLLIPASRRRVLPWLKAVIADKLSKFVVRIYASNYWISVASSKRVYQLLESFKSLNFEMDCIYAHTLPSLYPATKLASKKGVPFVFDVEDYHPEEIIHKSNKDEKNRRISILRNNLPHAKRVTAASPLIGVEVEKLLNWKSGTVSIVNNSFFSNEFILPKMNSGGKVRFVWFSQTISYGRGLELFISAARKYRNEIEIVLIGNIDLNFFEEHVQNNNMFISIKEPMSQIELHKDLSTYDVGLAVELSNLDFNRDICLTNKLFAYLQAGLFLFATDTKAQVEFLSSKSDISCICDQNVISFEENIEKLLNSIDEIRLKKLNRYTQANKYAFEEEAKKLELQF
jgi:glycosyltransferase involved in cell wall biosynthesis